jgi:flagellar protein FlgJ
MTLPPISSLTPDPRIADATAAAAPRAAAAVEPTAEQRRVAQEFEAIFMRQLLGSMEKSGGIAGGSDHGAAMYRSMMVGAMADNAAQAGGIGLSELVLKAMLPPTAAAAPALAPAPSTPAPSLADARPEAALLHQATVAPRADQRPFLGPAPGPGGVMPALPGPVPAGLGLPRQRADMSAVLGLVPQGDSR